MRSNRKSAFTVLRDARRIARRARAQRRRRSREAAIALIAILIVIAAIKREGIDGLLSTEMWRPLTGTLQAAAETITGRASVIDGDTIDVRGTRIRLNGIDAPESRQACQDATGAPYRCGQKAALYLSDLIAGRPVICDPSGQDRYGRALAFCSVAGRDIGASMVAAGWALAYRQYSTRYVADERRAQTAGAGIWQGAFDAPWDWRESNR